MEAKSHKPNRASSDRAGKQYEPFQQPDGALLFSPDADPVEMREWASGVPRQWFFIAHHMVRAMDFLRDGNRIKRPLAKAERWFLAKEQFAKALAEARRIESGFWIDLAQQGLDSLSAQYVGLMLEAIEAFHAEHLAKVRATKSGVRQLKSARMALKELARFNNRTLPPKVAERYHAVLAHWRDQEAISAAHETE